MSRKSANPPPKKGQCKICGAKQRLTRNGLVGEHSDLGSLCKGTGRAPVRGTQTTPPATVKGRPKKQFIGPRRPPASKDPETPKVCTACTSRPRYSRYSVCSPCLLEQGGRVCATCKKAYRPRTEKSGKRTRCPWCAAGRRSSKASARYAEIPAGAPSLGKRR